MRNFWNVCHLSGVAPARTIAHLGLGALLAGTLPQAATAHAAQASGGSTPFSVAQSCFPVSKEVYRCGDEPFRGMLASARVIALQTDAMDRYTRRELKALVERLGKEVAAPGQPADLTLRIVPVGAVAISMGPADRPLASLQVLARSGQEGHGTLVWDETLEGQPDRPWPSVVRAVIDQFGAHAAGPDRLSRR